MSKTWPAVAVRFIAPRECIVEEETVAAADLSGGQFVLETECSIVSVGTEVANYSGIDPTVFVPGAWNAYPSTPGYGAVGRVLAVSPEGASRPDMPQIGQRVFAFTPHVSVAVGDIDHRFVLPLEESDDAVLMVLVRMAGVAITAVRRAAGLQPGASAVVLGLGLVGNFAAQLLQLAGLEVRAFDVDGYRTGMARSVGIERVYEESPDVERGAGTKIVAAGGADIVVEATGLPALAMAATHLARLGGQIVLLGSPRAPHVTDATALLRDVHLRGLTVTGALEWTLPLTARHRMPGDTWSMAESYAYLRAAITSGRLKGRELVSKMARPSEAPSVYRDLLEGKQPLLSVVFDWA